MTRPAEIDTEALKSKAAAGMSATKIGEDLACSRISIMRRANKLGIEVPGKGKQTITSIESEIADMKPVDAVEHLLAILREYLKSISSVDILKVVEHGFTASEAKLILAIFSDKLQSKEMIYNILYGMRADGELVEPKIIDVFVCKVRKKMRNKGWGVSIETVWGRGYRGERLDGFLFPWEQN